MTRPTRTRGEAGFTLLEMIIVVIIIAILMAGAWVAMRSANAASRRRAMTTASASVDQAMGAFNRMYPPVDATQPDTFWQRSQGSVWSGNTGAAAQGLTDETGEWLLAQWPNDPYSTGGVEVTRYGSDAGCTAGQPGEVHVCRTSPGTMLYHVVGWAKDDSGAPVKVYDMRHGVK